MIFVLGYAENPVDQKFDPPDSQIINKRRVRPVIDRWLQPATVERGLAATSRDRWTELLSTAACGHA